MRPRRPTSILSRCLTREVLHDAPKLAPARVHFTMTADSSRQPTGTLTQEQRRQLLQEIGAATTELWG